MSVLKMQAQEKKKILQRLTTRVRTGLLFLEVNYLKQHPQPDVAWIRNIYILLSFYTELLFKAVYAYKKDWSSLKELDEIFHKQGHDLEEIGRQIGPEILEAYGILEIKSKNHEYHIRTDVGDYYVTDFVDIRYDFMDNRLRTITGDEHEMFDRQIRSLNRVNSFLLGPAWS